MYWVYSSGITGDFFMSVEIGAYFRVIANSLMDFKVGGLVMRQNYVDEYAHLHLS